MAKLFVNSQKKVGHRNVIVIYDDDDSDDFFFKVDMIKMKLTMNSCKLAFYGKQF